MLAVLPTPSLRVVCSDDVDSLEESWSQCAESLAHYSETTFAKRCLGTLTVVYSQRVRMPSIMADQPQASKSSFPVRAMAISLMLSIRWNSALPWKSTAWRM